MSQMHFDGPVEVSPELAMALFESMPDVGKAGVAQMFAARLMSGPLTDKAIEAAARVYMERIKIGQSGAKALRDGVAEKCRALGEKTVNVEQVRAIVDDAMRTSAAEFARTKMDVLASAIPVEALIAAATPAIVDVVKALATQYFTRTQKGQQWILDLIEEVKSGEADMLNAVVAERLQAAAAPVISRSVGEAPETRRRKSKDNGEI